MTEWRLFFRGMLGMAFCAIWSGSITGSAAPSRNMDGHYKRSCTQSECHAMPEATGALQHVPFLEEDCGACHVDHRQKQPHQMRSGGDSLCLECHKGIDKGPMGSLLHPPSAGADSSTTGTLQTCLDCHDPHSSRIRSLLRNERHLKSCAECHKDLLDKTGTYPYNHGYFNPESQCGFCHSAHQKGKGHYLLDELEEGCLTCHNLALRTKTRQLENVGRSLKEENLVHGAMRQGSCASCHTPHGSVQPALLREGYPAGNYARYDTNQYSLCWQCHSKKLAESLNGRGATQFRSKEINLHRLHLAQLGRGRACHMCHAAHASSKPHLLRETVTFQQWQAPFEYREEEAGGSCATACHREKSYAR